MVWDGWCIHWVGLGGKTCFCILTWYTTVLYIRLHGYCVRRILRILT
jgi:hypothetical protein